MVADGRRRHGVLAAPVRERGQVDHLTRSDTIFAISSGAAPAAIAVVRVSGPDAVAVTTRLAGTLPPPRRAAVRALRHPGDGRLLDRCLVLVFPAPRSSTGEDLVELHLHGGRAVVRAVEDALASIGPRRAEAGEFTSRALANGRIDLPAAEGLGDLLLAETEAQRRAALDAVEGAVSRLVAEWSVRALGIAAAVEAVLDFADEDDVAPSTAEAQAAATRLADEIEIALATPPVERLRDGIRVVLAGPPNSGKSTLFNALAERDAAIVSPVAGTTRDLIEAPVMRGGVTYLLVDTAGLAEGTADPIERIGIGRAHDAVGTADVVLWLGDDRAPTRPATIRLHARADLPGREDPPAGTMLAVAAASGSGVAAVWDAIAEQAAGLLRGIDRVLMNGRQRGLLAVAVEHLRQVEAEPDQLVAAEHLRSALLQFDRVTGRAGTEQMLDALFARFCIGK